ncbi:MAG TPA: hypothetical protein VNW90_19280 [Acetobacteraceae bacterium]|jgi:hypothetical protein|nr:hypothetical protein [Acetobacteraceae bacterium]
MPFLEDRQVAELLSMACSFSGFGWHMPGCDCHVAKDYCRSCDEFYWLHLPGCSYETDKHHGHRLTIVPFVEER